MASHLHLAPSPEEAAERASEPGAIRVVVADDHSLIRRSVRMLLEGEADLELVAEAEDIPSAASQVNGRHPNVLVLDLSMPGVDGFDAIEAMIADDARRRVVVLSGSDDPDDVAKARSAGAVAYLTKERIADELVPSVIAAAAR